MESILTIFTRTTHRPTPDILGLDILGLDILGMTQAILPFFPAEYITIVYFNCS